MSNPYAPPTVYEPKTRNRVVWPIVGITFITLGVMTPVILLTLFGILPIGLGAIIALLNLSAGIVMIALGLPAQTEPEKRRNKLLLWLIPVLSILIMGGTIIVHTVRLSNRARAAQREAMYQRDMAQKAAEQAERQQHEIEGSPARD